MTVSISGKFGKNIIKAIVTTLFFCFSILGFLVAQETDSVSVVVPDSAEIEIPTLEAVSDTFSTEEVALPETVEAQVSPEPELDYDSSPVQVAFAPSHKTVGFPLDSVLTISFSRPVRNSDDTFISYEQINDLVSLKSKSRRGLDVPFSADINAERTLITIRPESKLDEEETFFFSISSGLEDASNNPIKPVTVRFKSQMTLAVLNFQLQGLSSIENRTLLTFVRSELNATGVARCLEQEEMNAKLKENGIDPTGCNADDCAAKIGTALGVSYMVMTDFARLEKSEDYLTSRVVLLGDVSMRLLSVKTQKLKNKVHREFSGGLNHLGRIVRRMTWDLLGVKPVGDRFGPDVENISLLERIKNELIEFIVSPREWLITHPELAIGIGAVVLFSAGISLFGGSSTNPAIGSPPEYPEVP